MQDLGTACLRSVMYITNSLAHQEGNANGWLLFCKVVLPRTWQWREHSGGGAFRKSNRTTEASPKARA